MIWMFMLGTSGISKHHCVGQQVSGPGYFGTRNVADEIVDARELTDVLHRGTFSLS